MAQAVAREADAVHLDLDTVAWDDAALQRRPLARSLAAIDAFVGVHSDWVVEGCYSDLLVAVVARCSRLVFLNPGIDACIQNCRRRPWEPHKYTSREAQDANLDMLIGWIRDYEVRQDEFSLHSHRRLFDDFVGDKVEFTSNLPPAG